MLMKSVKDHFKMVASKARAKAKLNQMEREAAEEDTKEDGTEEKTDVKEDKEEEVGGKRLRRRGIHWEHPTVLF
jgi:hypothetical protein